MWLEVIPDSNNELGVIMPRTGGHHHLVLHTCTVYETQHVDEHDVNRLHYSCGVLHLSVRKCGGRGHLRSVRSINDGP